MSKLLSRARGTHNTGKADEATAAAAQHQEAEGVHDNEGDEGEEEGHCMAAFLLKLRYTPALPELIVESKHPRTSNDDPHKEEDGDDALEAAAPSSSSICSSTSLLFIRVLLPHQLTA